MKKDKEWYRIPNDKEKGSFSTSLQIALMTVGMLTIIILIIDRINKM